MEYKACNVSKCIISQPIPKCVEIDRRHCGLHSDFTYIILLILLNM